MATTEVETAQGRLSGRERRGVHQFRGIPYARPPVGERRFRAPEPPLPYAGVRDATRFGGSAPQNTIPMMEVGEQSEDCLYLNVWTPQPDQQKRPVMMWIHGGAFVIGSGAQREYDGTQLALRGEVVVVTVNYRLGALGFTYLDEVLQGRLPTDSNVGIRDLMAALRWLRENVHVFGGDPDNITLFGESAGGMCTGTLLGTPAAQGLFHKAIPQSGAAHHSLLKKDANHVAEVLLRELEIDASDPGALLEVSPERIVAAGRRAWMARTRVGPWQLPNSGMGLLPVVDGDLLPQHPFHAICDGVARHVPLLTGTTRDEWRLFMDVSKFMPRRGSSPPWDNLTQERLPEVLDSQVPGHGERAAEVYAAAAGRRRRYRNVYQALETDRVFRIPAIRLAEAQARHQPATYMYRFDWESPMFGACHAVDIPFVFHGVDTGFGRMLTGGGPKAQRLADQVSDAWAQFAHAGDPGHGGLPTWPTYDADERSTMLFNTDCTVESAPRDEQRRFWEPLLSHSA